MASCSSPQQTAAGSGNGGGSGGSSGTVTVLGVITGEQQENLEKALAPFEEKTGIDVVYEGTDAFTTLLPIRVDSGRAPDVALFPQPGLMTEFIANGQMVPITDLVEQEKLQAAYPQDWLDLATFEGQVYGMWLRAAVKSLVWYSPKEFAEKGYAVPKTWDEMLALSDRIAADGGKPWCVGIQSGDATGWVATDWIEDIMLRTAGPEVYDQWVAHEIPFNAEPVQTAFETFGNIAANRKYVSGGGVASLSIPVGDAILGLFTDPPRCYLHRQSNFIGGFVPEGVEPGQGVAVFPLPPINEKFGTPILVGG
ncbi:MAG TPA: ABC transporter substrate-binding protein, partial [Leptolyngbyaceae cyanobacterium]